MNSIIFSAELVMIPGLGAYPVFTALLLLYAASFIFGFGTGYALAIMRVLFTMPFK